MLCQYIFIKKDSIIMIKFVCLYTYSDCAIYFSNIRPIEPKYSNVILLYILVNIYERVIKIHMLFKSNGFP